MIVNFGLRKSEGPVQYAPFMLPLLDAGSGAVNTVLARGTGSATFTRAGATATTVLSTGLVSSTIAANTARSYYDPAPTGGTGSYMYLPGVSGAYASTTDSTAVSITGDIDIRVQVALTDWTPATYNAFLSSLTATQGFEFLAQTGSTGGLTVVYGDGAGQVLRSSTASVAFSDGAIGFVRVTRSSSTGDINFYTSTDGATWTLLGATVASPAGSIADSNTTVNVGARTGTTFPVNGRIYRAQIYSGINGTLVADFDPTRTTQASTSFAASTGETWTVNGRGFIYAAPAYLGYLAEEARTNLVLRSSDFSLAWAAVGTPTRSAAAKTCGSVNLDLIGDDSAAALEGYTQTITYTADATKVVSFFIAQGTSTSVMVRLRDTTAPADRLLAAITWAATGLPTITMTTGTSLGYQIFPNGIFRISLLSASVTAANTNSLEFYPASTAALAVANTGDVYIGGVESNNAAFSTSYIPTAAATVTRAADVLTYPLAGNFNSATGTAFAKINRPTASNTDSSTQKSIIADGGVGSNWVLYYQPNGSLTMYDGTTAVAIVAVDSANTTYNLASSWGAVQAIYKNGGSKQTGAFDGTMLSTSIGIGHINSAVFLNGCIRDVRILQRVLSDSQIASIR